MLDQFPLDAWCVLLVQSPLMIIAEPGCVSKYVFTNPAKTVLLSLLDQLRALLAVGTIQSFVVQFLQAAS